MRREQRARLVLRYVARARAAPPGEERSRLKSIALALAYEASARTVAGITRRLRRGRC